jgi:[NiFe] hydrogenase diaphorase moiety large subunit
MHSGAVAGIVDRVVTRYRRDPSCMVQILREVQEACDWISPEAIDRLQTTLGRAAHQDRGRRRFLFVLLYPAARQVPGPVLGQHHRPHARQQGADGGACATACGSSRGKVSEDGLVSVGKTTSCTGMCDQGPALLVKRARSPADRRHASTRSPN